MNIFRRIKKENVVELSQPEFRILEYDGKFTIQQYTWQPSLRYSYFYYKAIAEYDNLIEAKERLELLKQPKIIHT